MVNASKDYPFLETIKAKFEVKNYVVHTSKKIKTGICGFCGKATSKKSKIICLDCTTKRLKEKYITNKNGKIR